MIYESENIVNYLVTTLNKNRIKYDMHKLGSGLVMIDIWHKNSFYVVQIEEEWIGFSQVNEDDPGFDTIADMKFFSADAFVEKFKTIIY